jgi:hypothetical protein
MPKHLSDLQPHDPDTIEFYEALPHITGQPFMDNIDPHAEAHARHAVITMLIIAVAAAVLLGTVIAAGLSLVQ